MEKQAVLVYQAGIANIFEVKCFNSNPFGRDAKRIMQGDFRTCESFARGLGYAGYLIASMGCNMAGDIINQQWDLNLESQPFSDKFNPVFCGVSQD